MFDHTRGIVRNLVLIYEDACSELIEKLDAHITTSVNKQYSQLKEDILEVPFSEILHIYSDYEKNLSNILYHFGFFARAIWCSVLATRFYQLFLPLIKQRMKAMKERQSLDIHQDNTHLFLVFKRLMTILPYCTKDRHTWSKQIHSLFEPYLTPWSQLIISKAQTQIDRVLRLEKEKFASKDLPDSGARKSSGCSMLSRIYEDDEDDS